MTGRLQAKPLPNLTPTQKRSILARLIRHNNGCWEWSGKPSRAGYGTVSFDGSKYGVHRLMLEMFSGPVPSDRVIDHLCRNRRCAAPSHLEAVSNTENVLRGSSMVAEQARMTHCNNGHEFTEENTYENRRAGGGTGRQCRECRRVNHTAYMREYNKRMREVS